jgi:hypothetical protein
MQGDATTVLKYRFKPVHLGHADFTSVEPLGASAITPMVAVGRRSGADIARTPAGASVAEQSARAYCIFR